jgi:hypothetical protein
VGAGLVAGVAEVNEDKERNVRKLTRTRLELVDVAVEDFTRPETACVWIEEDGTAMATDGFAIVTVAPAKLAAGEKVRIPARIAKAALGLEDAELTGLTTDLYELREEAGRLIIGLGEDECSVPSQGPQVIKQPKWRGKTVPKFLAATPRAEFRIDVRRLRDLCTLLEKLGNRAGMRVVIPQGETEPVIFLGEADSGEEVVAALMPMQLGDGRGKWAKQLAKEYEAAQKATEEGQDG